MENFNPEKNKINKNYKEFYINNILNQLIYLKEINSKIEREYTDLMNFIRNIQRNIIGSTKYKQIKEKIYYYIELINANKKNNNNEDIFKEDIQKNIKEIFVYYCNIYENKDIKNISTSINDLSSKINDINNYFDISTTFNKYNRNKNISIEQKINKLFYCDKNKEYENESNKIKFLKCKNCSKEGIYYCNHCIDYYCKNCRDIRINDVKHNFILMNEKKKQKEREKNEFLEKFVEFIKNYIFKVNYILKYENQNYVDIQLNHGLKDDINTEILFLKEINNVYKLIQDKKDIERNIYKKDLSSILFT